MQQNIKLEVFKMKVEQLDLTTQYQSIKEEINSAIISVLKSGIVINGDNVKKIENSIATYSNSKSMSLRAKRSNL